MTEDEFRLFAEKEGYTAPECKTQPPNAFFDQHAHKNDLIAFIQAGEFIVETDKNRKSFKAGELCTVEAGLVHTDSVARDGAKYLMAWHAAQTQRHEKTR